MLKREAALRVAAGWVGKTEHGGNNDGAFVNMLQRADTLPGENYAWCQDTMNGAWRLATGGRIENGRIVGGEMLAEGVASVGFFRDWCRRLGYMVDRPLAGDFVLFHLDGNSNWPDHVGIIEKVLGLGTWLRIRTIEGNTGSGSQADGDGVWRNVRYVRADLVEFARIPGVVEAEPARPSTRQGYWDWLRWTLGESEYKRYGPLNPKGRPDVPVNVPAEWVEKRRKFIARRGGKDPAAERLGAINAWAGGRRRADWGWDRIKGSANWRERKRLRRELGK